MQLKKIFKICAVFVVKIKRKSKTNNKKKKTVEYRGNHFFFICVCSKIKCYTVQQVTIFAQTEFYFSFLVRLVKNNWIKIVEKI